MIKTWTNFWELADKFMSSADAGVKKELAEHFQIVAILDWLFKTQVLISALAGIWDLEVKKYSTLGPV